MHDCLSSPFILLYIRLCRPFFGSFLFGGRGQDERMLDLMGYMDAPSLGRLAFVSHALYVYAHVEDLWKGLVVRVSSAWRGPALPITSEPVIFQRVWEWRGRFGFLSHSSM